MTKVKLNYIKRIAFNNFQTLHFFLMKLSDNYNQIAVTALLRILLKDFFEGGIFTVPPFFFLGIKQLENFLS